jgi:hypothetical protein
MLVYLRFSDIIKNYRILVNRKYTTLNSQTYQISRMLAIIIYNNEL